MIRSLLILCLALTVVGCLGLNPSIAQDDNQATSPAPAETVGPSQDETPLESSTDVAETGPKYTKWTALVASITIFVLAVFVGFEIITKVPPTLHTPLMSGSNAISGISIVGALLSTALGENWFASLLGLLAIIMATVNVVGGYMVTHRMLSMFQKR